MHNKAKTAGVSITDGLQHSTTPVGIVEILQNNLYTCAYIIFWYGISTCDYNK